MTMPRKSPLEIKVKLLRDDAKLPTRNKDSAGLDLYVTRVCSVSGSAGTLIESRKEMTCMPGRVYKAETGIAVEPPAGYWGLIKPRSGMSLRNGLGVLGGVVDNDFRGEVAIIFTVESQVTVKVGDRIAQMVLLPYICPEVVKAENLSDTSRGDSGYGSSGK